MDATKIKIEAEDCPTFQKLLDILQPICITTQPSLASVYKKEKFLGDGATAKVHLYSKNCYTVGVKTKYAVKTFKLNTDSRKALSNEIISEINILRILGPCENIIDLEAVFLEREQIHLVMRYAKHGCLFDLIVLEDRYCEKDVKIIMGQLILATDFIHQNSYLHRDIKPANILMLENKKGSLNVCIADLGIACPLDDETIS